MIWAASKVDNQPAEDETGDKCDYQKIRKANK